MKRKDKDTDGRKIKAIYEHRNSTVGYRLIQDELYLQYRLVVNHKKVLRLMRDLGIKATIRRKYVHRTSCEAAVSDGRIAENLLKRDSCSTNRSCSLYLETLNLCIILHDINLFLFE
ncbi:IS3 family transposase [Paenibacillus sp. FSL P4-0184]|uniref:IS3 family transposase n=1 Tax=Paenibacillus sp. FSL P4-0184 TaxID=2921632 RepID=UPI004046E8F5